MYLEDKRVASKSRQVGRYLAEPGTVSRSVSLRLEGRCAVTEGSRAVTWQQSEAVEAGGCLRTTGCWQTVPDSEP